MNYKHPPIYKYALLLICVYMLLKHQKLMSADKLLINSIIITCIIAIFDYILIEGHPKPLESKTEKEDYDDLFEEDDEKIINNYDVSILDDLETELEENDIGDTIELNVNGISPNHRIGNNYDPRTRGKYMRQYYST